MQRSILAVSPNLQFLEQIRSHLEEGGRYRVQGVTSGVDALSLVKDSFFDLAVLDAESSDVPFVPFTRDLVAIQPGLKLLVFPPQNNPHHPVLTGLVANGFLNKPFFTPEVSRALKNILEDNTEEPVAEFEPTDDLAELWTKRPEMGINRVEQLLGSTTAQTGLLVSKGRVIAGSGPSDDITIQHVLNLLDLHRLDNETLELLRFITLENEGGQLLIYASQLIKDITLVLFYPPSASIQLVRQEVYQVKQEFKQAYPTTGELRMDLGASGEIESRIPVLPATEEFTPPTAQDIPIPPEGDALMPLEDEIGSDDLDSVLSLVELKNLDNMLADMPSPDPEVEETPAAEDILPPAELEETTWLPLSETQDETIKNPFDEIELIDVQKESIESSEETVMPIDQLPPPLPAEFLEQVTTPASEFPFKQSFVQSLEGDLIDSSQPESASTIPDAEFPIVDQPATIEPEPLKTENAFPDFDFDLPWERAEPGEEKIIDSQSSDTPEENIPAQDLVNENETAAVTDNAGDEDFLAWLNELGGSTPLVENDATNPQIDQEILQPTGPIEPNVTIPAVEPTPESESFSEPAQPPELDAALAVTSILVPPKIEDETPAATEVSAIQDEVVPPQNEETTPAVMEFAAIPDEVVPPQWAEELPDVTEVPAVLDQVVLPQFGEETPAVTEVQGVPEEVIPPQIEGEAPEVTEGPPPLPTDSYNANLSSEPGTRPLGIRNFRFQYTCLLIPRNAHQFLTHDLSERLSFLLPQLHLEYGWHMTGISIRPQYMLWSISVPMKICPVQVIQEIRHRTTSHLFSNFPYLNPDNAESDFWAAGYLALSGTTSLSVGMIFDFISQNRKNQNLHD